MSNKFLKTKNKLVRHEGGKIKWYRRRWVWGIVAGVIVMVVSFIIYPYRHIFNIFTILPLGFSVILQIIPSLIRTSVFKNLLPNFFKPRISTFNLIYVFIFSITYYLAITLSLKKTFKEQRIKFKYFIFFLLLIILALAGFYILGSAAS